MKEDFIHYRDARPLKQQAQDRLHIIYRSHAVAELGGEISGKPNYSAFHRATFKEERLYVTKTQM